VYAILIHEDFTSFDQGCGARQAFVQRDRQFFLGVCDHLMEGFLKGQCRR